METSGDKDADLLGSGLRLDVLEGRRDAVEDVHLVVGDRFRMIERLFPRNDTLFRLFQLFISGSIQVSRVS